MKNLKRKDSCFWRAQSIQMGVVGVEISHHRQEAESNTGSQGQT